MPESIITHVIIPTLAAIGSGLAGWLFGRRKRAADATAAEIGNLDRIIEMWQRTAEHFKQTARELMEQNINITHELASLREENKSLIMQVENLNAMVKELECQNKALIRKINDIKRLHNKNHEQQN